MFMFDRCHHSWAVETPDKYEHDWKYLTYPFAKSKFPAMEIDKWSFSTPSTEEFGRDCDGTWYNFTEAMSYVLIFSFRWGQKIIWRQKAFLRKGE